MYITENINSDMENIMARAKYIFARPWDEEDCEYLVEMMFDDAVNKSNSSEELQRAVQRLDMTFFVLFSHFREKSSEQASPF